MPAKPAADQPSVRAFVVNAISEGRSNLATALQTHFAISRATSHNYLRGLEREGVIRRLRRGHYGLATTIRNFGAFVEGLEEHQVWDDQLKPLLRDLPENVQTLWEYGCTEMINNVIDHSESPRIHIQTKKSAKSTEMHITDYGVGIFRKIARALNLEDDRHAVLELSKGKVTTDPANHSGEGIFFSSRAFDSFRILSGGVFFAHDCEDGQDWILGDEQQPEEIRGTTVFMSLSNNTERQLQDIFDEFATDTEDYRFDKTVVPVKLLQYGDDRLVSRSQAKRLLARFDRFRTVVLNFDNVESIGQAFADEVFRVFPSQHPKIDIVGINANEQVTRMMNRALSERQPQADLFANDARGGGGPQTGGPEGRGPDGHGPDDTGPEGRNT
jgi:anti-sigma regulatory factor (Ser/Thr protein kinase)